MSNKCWRYGTPNAPVGESEEYFVAVRYETNYREKEIHEVVLQLQYCNKPLQYDEEGELLPLEYYHVDESGEPVEAVGWHTKYEHSNFDGYYVPIHHSWEVVAYQSIDKPTFPKTGA
jgi:hypothetical protein